MIGILLLTGTTAMNCIVQGTIVGTILFGAVCYKIIPKPLNFK